MSGSFGSAIIYLSGQANGEPPHESALTLGLLERAGEDWPDNLDIGIAPHIEVKTRVRTGGAIRSRDIVATTLIKGSSSWV